MRCIKLAVLTLLSFILVSCTSIPPTGVPAWAGSYRKACLPEAIAVAQGLREEDIQARVLSIHTEKWGHAVCVYMYPPGKNKLWVWDSQWQSVSLRAWYDDPMSVARAWMNWRHDTTPVLRAYYQEDIYE